MILADENFDNRILRFLRDNNIKVLSVSEDYHGISDFEIIQIARNNNLIILKEDKDFGDWVFAHKESNITVIFLRYLNHDYMKVAKILGKILTDRSSELKGYFTTITLHKIRKRKI